MAIISVVSGIVEAAWEARKGGMAFLKALQPVLPEHQRVAIWNSTWMFASRVGSQVFAAAFTIIVARGLGETGLGQYIFFASLLMIANIATTFGTDTYLVREIAAHPRNAPEAVKGTLVVQLFFSGLVIITCGMAANVHLLSNEFTPTVLIFSLSLIPLSFYSVFSAVLRAREQMHHYMYVTLFNSGLQAIGAWFVIGLGGGLIGLAILTLATSTFSSFLGGYLYRRSGASFVFSRPVSVRKAGKIIQLALPLALLTGVGVIYQRSTFVMLGWMAGDAATGWYSASFRVVEVFKIVHFSVLGGLFPLMARFQVKQETLLADNFQRFQSLSRWSFLFLSAISLAGVFIIRITAPSLINLVYGSEFGASVPLLQTQAWIMLPYVVTSHRSLLLVIRGQEQLVFQSTLLALLLLLGLSLVFIPMLGAMGAVWASFTAETGLAIILWTFRSRQEDIN